ncbi:type II RES/Xre toxin-antitoxin system antitoxin [Cyclobacterium plantarum]|uniref:DUF2384 domain-containing protein n=1 Tax=Cyclobacterium plantarum TaxID=2716263 RepID=A0ABX0H887_9BACT|nr:antitoxin Xre/MbcA/ParS toxin-binding domain-containing protein [Cyclobacterium plantarum]NHE58094.1 DUF2384 domain-containing protein [Cyclobacterium plantarum]
MEVRDDFQVVYQVDKGIHIDLFDELLKKSGLQKQVLSALLGLDPRTIDNYRNKGRSFGALEGELLLKLNELFEFGAEVFESSKVFRDWLHSPAFAFDNKQPLDFLKSNTGVDLVMQALLRIAHGYVV